MNEVEKALRRHRSKLLVVDFGVWPHYQSLIMDTGGGNAGSSLVGTIGDLKNNEAISREVLKFLPSLKAMREELRENAQIVESQRDAFGVDGLGEFSLLTLQRKGDQTLLLDCPPQWREPEALARAAIKEAERARRFLVIKLHPMQEGHTKLELKGPYHRVVTTGKYDEFNSRQLAWLLANARNVIMANSSTHYQSLALGRPTVCLGRGNFTGNGVVEEVNSIEEIFDHTYPRESDEYLCHVLSRQRLVDEFQSPEELGRLVSWVLQCDSYLKLIRS